MTDRSIAWFGGGDRPVNGSGNTVWIKPTNPDDADESAHPTNDLTPEETT
jgi:hypothetical protein